MKIIDELEKSINESIDMDKKSTFSAKLFNVLALCFSALAAALLLFAFASFLIFRESWIDVWVKIFYFVIIFIPLGLYFAIIQRIRGGYLTSKISIWICVFSILMILTLIIIQLILYGKVFFYQFNT